MAAELEAEVPAFDRGLLECSAEEIAAVSAGSGRERDEPAVGVCPGGGGGAGGALRGGGDGPRGPSPPLLPRLPSLYRALRTSEPGSPPGCGVPAAQAGG